MDAGADAKVRVGSPPKNSAFRRGVSVPLKVKNELGYTAYDLSLRGGATGEGFFSANFKCFFGKVSRKRLFLFLLFFCFFWFRTGCEECREMLQEASWESKDFQGPRWSDSFLIISWWFDGIEVSSFHEFFTQTWGAWDLCAGFVVSKHATRCQVATFLKLFQGRPFGCTYFNVKVPDSKTISRSKMARSCKGEFERKTVFPLAFCVIYWTSWAFWSCGISRMFER